MSTTMEVVRCQACDAVLEVIPEGGTRSANYCAGCGGAEPYGSTSGMAPGGEEPRRTVDPDVCCDGEGVELRSTGVEAIYHGVRDDDDPSRVHMDNDIWDHNYDDENTHHDVVCRGCGSVLDVEVIW